jgi:hypothetical protein
MLIDSLKTITADANSPFTNATAKLTIDARIQISRSTDGTHIFYLWMDSDPTAAGGENAAPDLFGKGLNVTTGGIAPTTQFTFDGGNYYMYASNITLVNGTNYSIPSSVSTSRDGSGDGLMPFNHYYVSGIQFKETDFVVATGINENTNAALSFSLFPNPVAANTNLTFTVANKGNVTIKVYDITGQLVSVVTSQDYAAGSHSINLNVEKLNSGIYFVNMTTANGTASKKMIIK